MQSTVHTVGGFTCEVRSDSIWFTIYDSYGEPAGTLERPHRGCNAWRVWAYNGQEIGNGYVMARAALRAFNIWAGN